MAQIAHDTMTDDDVASWQPQAQACLHYRLAQAVIFVPLLAAMLFGAGCFGGGAAPPGEPQLLDTLPTGWTPLSFGRGGLFGNASIWQPINIDDDLPTEFLLLYTYDNGQVGATIYDQQTGSTGVVSATPVPAPNQPAGTFIPYRLAPSFWAGAGRVGYIAPPNTDASVIHISQVQRPPPPTTQPAATVEAEQGTEVTPAPVPTGTTENPTGNNELVILGGNTVINVIWWRNPFNGYGITQFDADGGLQPTYLDDDTTKPIQSAVGLEPLRGPLRRSYLCRRLLFTREPAANPSGTVEPVFQYSVRYVQEERGIGFCATPPAFPFYPEGVVMAFLQPADPSMSPTDLAAYRNQFIAPSVDEATRQGILALIDLDGPDNATVPGIIVEDLLTPLTIALTPDYRSPAGGPLTTSVCAQINATDGMQSRRLLFQMYYSPPTQVTENGQTTVTGDRFYIGFVTDVTAVGINCQAVLGPSMVEGVVQP